MRNRLIDELGSYREMSFTGTNGKWSLIKSESVSEERGTVMLTLDTFKSEKGELKTMKRIEVDRLFEEGKIWL